MTFNAQYYLYTMYLGFISVEVEFRSDNWDFYGSLQRIQPVVFEIYFRCSTQYDLHSTVYYIRTVWMIQSTPWMNELFAGPAAFKQKNYIIK